MVKSRVHDLASEFGVPVEQLMGTLREMNIFVRSHMSALEPDQVVVGNGADDLIELCFRAFAGAGDQVAFPAPTYPLLEPLCAIHEALAVHYPLSADWELPAGFAVDPAPLKFLVNPNSPTGTWSAEVAVEDVVARSRGVVVLDEAYVDFAAGAIATAVAQLRGATIPVATG